MSITIEDVEHMANLARLEIDTQTKTFYTEQLNSILQLVDQMNSIDTDNILPTAHPQDLQLRFREDDIIEADHRDDYQAIAPNVENGLYLVPKVIE